MKYLQTAAVATLIFFMIPVKLFSAEKIFTSTLPLVANSAKDARKLKGDIVKCAPEANGDIKAPVDAIRKLKAGMILHLLPGKYEDEVNVTADNVLIEGEPGEFYDLNLLVSGKGCSIRNLWFCRLRCDNDITVIDSVFNNFSSGKNTKANQIFDNCCIGSITLFHPAKTIFLNKCTISNGKTAIWLRKNKITIENSIVYAKKQTLFFCEKDGLIVKKSLLYSDENIGACPKAENNTNDLMKMSKLCKPIVTDSISEKPLFENEPSLTTDPKRADTSRIDDAATEWNYAWGVHHAGNVALKDFILKEGSPGKTRGYGANLSKEGFPVPY